MGSADGRRLEAKALLLGMEGAVAKDPSKAGKLIAKLNTDKDADALALKGVALFQGAGCKEDKAESHRVLTKAIKKGSHDAQYYMAALFLHDGVSGVAAKDRKAATALLHAASVAGVIEATQALEEHAHVLMEYHSASSSSSDSSSSSSKDSSRAKRSHRSRDTKRYDEDDDDYYYYYSDDWW